MPIIGWEESVPSNASRVGHAPPFFHSALTAMEAAIGASLLYAPGGGGASLTSFGEMQPGGPRTFFAARSASSNAAPGTLNGRLFFASDTSELFCYDSAGTVRVGTPFLIEGPSATLGPQQTWFLMSSQTTFISSASLTHSVPFPVAFDDAVGHIGNALYARAVASDADAVVSLSSLTVGGCTSSISWPTGGASDFTLFITAFGGFTDIT